MATQDINDYIAKQRKEGVSDEAIKKAMISTGWPETQVNQAFSPGSSEDFGGKLLGPGALLSKSFSILKSRFWTLIGIQLLPTFIAFLIGLVGALGAVAWAALGIGNNIAAIIVVVIVAIAAVIFAIYLSLWAQVAMFQAIMSPEKISIKEAFRSSKGKIGAFFWVSMLESLAVMGGFLLLIVPGIIFSIWFMFGNIIYVDQGVKGIAALAKSREYVRGMWWSIAGRIIVLFLIAFGFVILTGIVSEIFGSIADSKAVINIISQVAGIVIAPFATIYAVLIYKNLKSVKGDAVVEPKGTGWIKALAMWGIVGFILIPVGVGWAMVATINPVEQLKQARETQEKADILAIQNALSRYYVENQIFPQSLKELVPSYISEIPAGPFGNYTYSSSSGDYELCPPPSVGSAKICVTSTQVNPEFKPVIYR